MNPAPGDFPANSGSLGAGTKENAELQKLLEEMDRCQSDIDGLNGQASEEILRIVEKYNGLRQPYFEKRKHLITSIPNFWATAFMNHPLISSILLKNEAECLNGLKEIEVEEYADIKAGFKIIFFFNENPFFSNAELAKEFKLGSSGEPLSTSTVIEIIKREVNIRPSGENCELPTTRGHSHRLWLPGVDLCKKQKAIQNRVGQKRNSVSHRSFFSWFAENNDPSNDDIAEAIKEDLWSNPLQYYLSSDLDESASDSDDEIIEESD